METPSKDNSLYLTIKQVYFDQIVAGTKKDEYRDITPTTYKKYLECGDNAPSEYRDKDSVASFMERNREVKEMFQ